MTFIKDDFREHLGHSISTCSWHGLELHSSFNMEIQPFSPGFIFLPPLNLIPAIARLKNCLHTQNGFDPTLFFHQENQRLEFHSLHFNLATS